MGTLFWQLNDNWPVCSWSAIEYGGKWKLLMHFAKRFFAPLLVSAFKTEDSGFEIRAVNDFQQDVKGDLAVSFITLDGETAKTSRAKVKLNGGSAKSLGVLKSSDLPFKPAEGFVRLELTTDAGGAFNDFAFAKWKSMELPTPRIGIEAKELFRGCFEVEALTDKPAFFFSLDAPGVKGEFDGNCLTLLPGRTERFVYTAKQKLSLKQFNDVLSFKHLRQTFK